MSILKINHCGCTERETELNWAAEYARRLVTNEVKARIEAVDAEAAARAAADAAERTAREQADSSLHAAITSEELVRKAAIEAEAKARDAAISAESKIRQAAEAELSKRIDQEAIDRDMRVSEAVWELEQKITKVQNNLFEHKATETTERTEGDRALSARIDELSLACGNSYSETAQKIGTWIDGNDIYRAAFRQKISEIDQREKSVSLGSLTGTGDCFIIGAFAMVSSSDIPSVMDDHGTRFDANTISWDADNAALIYGYIDYVKTA